MALLFSCYQYVYCHIHIVLNNNQDQICTSKQVSQINKCGDVELGTCGEAMT